MSKALITGVFGQDGYYLAELLLDKGYQVIGSVRAQNDSNRVLPEVLQNRIEVVDLDISKQSSFEDVISNYCPSEIYNFAAYSSGVGMYDNPIAICELNGVAVAKMLEGIKNVNPEIRFCQASSSEMFGKANESPQSENTRFNPRSPYGAAKLYAHNMINIYREQHGLFVCSAILYNHESPLRRLEFVTRNVSSQVAKIKLGLSKTFKVGNLNARRDWGYAKDYVNAMWLMLQRNQPEDYVLASGVTHSVRELCEIAFSHLGMNFDDYSPELIDDFRPEEEVELRGDPKKARDQLGWSPVVSFKELICMMVDADLKRLKNQVQK